MARLSSCYYLEGSNCGTGLGLIYPPGGPREEEREEGRCLLEAGLFLKKL